ncbi:MAG: hypothetical protein M0005_01520 [Actinomycetota bacterium]|nr:hypothetical protein [Actinomycetota bacterium]
MDEVSQEGHVPEADAGRDTRSSLSPWAADEGAFTEEAEFFEVTDEELDEGAGEQEETFDEQGRRHVRLAAPEGTEELLEKEAARRTSLPDWAERWRSRSATGTVLTAVAFGLKEVFEPERKEPAIVMETSGEPPKDLPVEAQLEQLGPRQSSVTVRPWLLAAGDDAAAGDQAAAERSGEPSAGSHFGGTGSGTGRGEGGAGEEEAGGA